MTRLNRRHVAFAFLLAALALAGCGDPYAAPKNSDVPPPPGEKPARAVPEQPDHVAREDVAATPEAAARQAAELTTNWTGETAARRYAAFARITVGAARIAARESAARLTTDAQLAAPGARSTGAVEAVATRSVAAARRELIVVTRETLTADGLREQRWRVTLATAERRRRGWVLSRWEPQP